MGIRAISLEIPEVLVIEPEVFEDDRGLFFESYNFQDFKKATSLSPVFVQDNHSLSTKGVLRGLHYQLPPRAQAKLVRVVKGEVFDVVVDIRASSKTLGKWVGVNLSDKNKRQLWVPEGFAHGFVVLSDTAEYLYKSTDYHVVELERSILWSDTDLAIEWPLSGDPVVSSKDSFGQRFSKADLFP